ncbi:MAG: hydroxyacylglutathione hydrolase [Petroclostridium sp.]|jgi:glyoxylase-like metal-dependent hydrolase (beta-lactamase superfamily II)|uniref:MBL fold metallo-hydrolase n=1 Tax=Petroclostridium xylanilyticum TaxID=1792311 RepID=UPI000B98B155|nr:MBL fold metallo-hydrolase [Petroclostridium xylanilyticum]MBZ4644843.1 beta-lactamase domain protein [Clostridia bacterium]MDK2809576.1 hydroxyacylglutathione hydrolase [Petroclostridium sp.]
MILKVLPVGQLKANCYIFGDENTNEVAVIDPGDEGQRIYDVIVQNGYKVIYIIATHGHVDHISAIKYLKEKSGAQVVIHQEDSEALLDSQKNLSALLGYHSIQVPADIKVMDGKVLNVGKYRLQIIHTPGHTPGGICILVDKILFSGDTLFEHSIGRTDLPGGNHQQLIKSIQDKLFVLPDDVQVYPGHGDKTTMGSEKKFNPFF